MKRATQPLVQQRLFIVFIALCAAAVQSTFQLADVYVTNASAGYVEAEAYRGVVYPAFLDLFETLGRPLRAAVIAQTWLFSISAAILAFTFARFSGRPTFGVVLILLLIFNPMTFYFNNSILTESLFQTALCLFLTAVIRLCYKLDRKSYLLLGMSAGLMIISRPVGYAALPVLVIALMASGYLNHRSIWKASAVSISCVVFVLSVESICYTFYQNAERETVLGNALFSKSGVISAGPSPYDQDDPRTEIWNFLEHDQAEAARDAIAQAPSGSIAFFIRHGFESDMLFRYKNDELAALAQKTGRSQRQLMGEVGAERIRQNTSGFLSLALRHYVAHWQPFYYAVSQEEIDRYVAENSPLPMNNASGRFVRDVYTPPFAAAIHAIFALGWIVSIAILALSILCFSVKWPGQRMLVCAGLGVFLLQGSLISSSVISVASVRNLAVLWPIVTVVICASLLLILIVQELRRQAT